MTEKKENRSTNFYENKGMIRQTIILTPKYIEILRTTSKANGLTQGELVEALLDNVNSESFIHSIVAKRDEKASGRTKKVSLVNKLKSLTPEQFAAVEAIIASANK